MIRTAALALLAVLALASAGPAGAAVAPGRVALPVGLPAPEGDVDAAGAIAGAVLPGGGAVLLGSRSYGRGAVLAELGPDGSLDPGFGDGGIAHLRAPGVKRFFPARVLVRPGGGLLVAGSGPARSGLETPQLVLLGVTADGSVDRAFGAGGVARPGLQGMGIAALGPGGAILVAGETGSVSPAIAHDPDAGNSFRPAVARLTPAGALDPEFGDGGVEPLPGVPAGDGYATDLAAMPDGRTLVLAGSHRRGVLVRLLPDGRADPAFAGGAPLAAPVLDPAALAVRSDGAAYALGRFGLARATAGGALDPSFGDGGIVTIPDIALGASLLVQPDGGALVSAPSSLQPRPAAKAPLRLLRVAPGGAVAQVRPGVPFGGGDASFRRAVHSYPPVPPLAQNGFTPHALLTRPDGSYLVVGGVQVVQYSGEGVGRSTALFAAAALTPGFGLDPAFGGPAQRPRVRVRLIRESPRHAYRARGVAVRLRTSGAGLARVTVRDRRGRLVARGVEPVYRAGRTTVRAQVRRPGAHVLHTARRLRVRVAVRFRDVVAQGASARTSGRLVQRRRHRAR